MSRVDADLRRESDPLVGDFADQAVQRANDTVLGAIGISAEDELRKIDTALARIAEGRYDLCAMCGGRIASVRLKVVPDTDLCAACASAAPERGAGRYCEPGKPRLHTDLHECGRA